LANRVTRVRTIEDEDGDLYDIDVVQKLFNEIAPRYAERNGGYTRMVKLGKRPGDNADMAMLMLVEN
jgi:large subunit ribosomal protein L17